MNTHTHLLATLAAARRARPGDRPAAWAAAAGAVLPDIPYLLRGAALLARRADRREAMTLLGYGGELCWPPDLALHSLLPPAAVLAAAAAMPPGRARRLAAAFGAGWAGHAVTDLPVHAGDARPPLWPLSGRRWHSPLSGWDRSRHAPPVATADLLLAAAAAAWLASRPRSPVRARLAGLAAAAAAPGHLLPGGLACQQGWRPHGRARAARLRGLGDLAAFARTFAAHPGQVGAVLPTSGRTVRAMLDMADWPAARVIAELGAGTGAYTRELLRRAAPDARILAFEVDPVLAARLRRQLGADRRLEVAAESAENLPRRLAGQRADIIVSALPLTTLPGPVRAAILAGAAASLGDGGVLLAIQYSAARRHDLERVFGQVTSRISLPNLPPAVLYACRCPRPAPAPVRA